MVILGLWEQLHNPNLNLSNSIGLEMKLDTKRLLCLRKSGLRTQMQLASSLPQKKRIWFWETTWYNEIRWIKLIDRGTTLLKDF